MDANELCTADLQQMRAAFSECGVVMDWDTDTVRLQERGNTRPTNAVTHARDGDLEAWLTAALNGAVMCRSLGLLQGWQI